VARSDHEANVRFPDGDADWQRLLRVEERTGQRRGAILRGLVRLFIEQWEELELARQEKVGEAAAAQTQALESSRDAIRRTLRSAK